MRPQRKHRNTGRDPIGNLPIKIGMREQRFGAASLWLLNTAAKEFALPGTASGADYMLMWTRVLEGSDGLGRDFDFVYFTGPSDFGQYFSFDGRADMAKLEKYYDGHAKADSGLRAISKTDFRNYYGLRASVSFSLGSHDEWNIFVKVNRARRRTAGVGLGGQLAMFFDGHQVSPVEMEREIAPGYEHVARPAPASNE